MREIYSHQDVTVLGYYKSILEAEGIAGFIRNEHSPTLGFGFYGMFQRLGFLEPVLCIVADDEYVRGRLRFWAGIITRPQVSKLNGFAMRAKSRIPLRLRYVGNARR